MTRCALKREKFASLVDNCSSHLNVELSNVEVIVLPIDHKFQITGGRHGCNSLYESSFSAPTCENDVGSQQAF